MDYMRYFNINSNNNNNTNSSSNSYKANDFKDYKDSSYKANDFKDYKDSSYKANDFKDYKDSSYKANDFKDYKDSSYKANDFKDYKDSSYKANDFKDYKDSSYKANDFKDYKDSSYKANDFKDYKDNSIYTNTISSTTITEQKNKILLFRNQNYDALKQECLSSRRLFEDPYFRPTDKSLFFKREIPPGIVWKRPGEIVKTFSYPIFMFKDATSFELDPGYLINSGFVPACTALVLVPELFSNVVPSEQICSGRNYAGIFYFRFWIYGRWIEVVIDDKLPVYSNTNKLVFCSNLKEPNEFWVPLFEKAYAKVCICYESLQNTRPIDALIDMTGAIYETINIEDMQSNEKREEIWEIIRKARLFKTMIGASIKTPSNSKEVHLNNGLITGCIYYINRVAMVEINEKSIKFVRLLNPWSDESKWNQAWSENSTEWNDMSDELKEAFEYNSLPKNEFWMEFNDFCANFHVLEFFNVLPDAYAKSYDRDEEEDEGKVNLTWKLTSFHGEWTPGSTSGGCGLNNEALFWTNPQILITINKADSNEDNTVSLLISLIQKNLHEKRIEKFGAEASEQFIQFRLYRVLNELDAEKSRLTGMRFYSSQLERCGGSGNYVNVREVAKRFKLKLGTYVLIPSCYDVNRRAEFLLRIFSENEIDEKMCRVLTEHKTILAFHDLFFIEPIEEPELGEANLKPVTDNETPNVSSPSAENSVLNALLSRSNSGSSSTTTSKKQKEKHIFELFDKSIYKQKNIPDTDNCKLM